MRSQQLQRLAVCLVKYAKSPANFYAERLYNTGKGIGTDEEGMTRIIVTRSEVSAGSIGCPPTALLA